jgi:hypothetical protein
LRPWDRALPAGPAQCVVVCRRPAALAARRSARLQCAVSPAYGNMPDSTNLIRLMQQIRPIEIYNLAAQSHVGVGFGSPEYTNAIGVLRRLEAVRMLGMEEGVRGFTTRCLRNGTVWQVPQEIPAVSWSTSAPARASPSPSSRAWSQLPSDIPARSASTPQRPTHAAQIARCRPPGQTELARPHLARGPHQARLKSPRQGGCFIYAACKIRPAECTLYSLRHR